MNFDKPATPRQLQEIYFLANGLPEGFLKQALSIADHDPLSAIRYLKMNRIRLQAETEKAASAEYSIEQKLLN